MSPCPVSPQEVNVCFKYLSHIFTKINEEIGKQNVSHFAEGVLSTPDFFGGLKVAMSGWPVMDWTG